MARSGRPRRASPSGSMSGSSSYSGSSSASGSRSRSRSRSRSFSSSSVSRSDSSRSRSPPPPRKSPTSSTRRGRTPPLLPKHSSPIRKPSSPPESVVLHIANLTRNVNEGHLKEIFCNFGEVVNVELSMDRSVQLPKGYGYVEFKTRADAEKALLYMDGGQIDGNVVSARFTLPPRTKASTPPKAVVLPPKREPAAKEIAGPDSEKGELVRQRESPQPRRKASPPRRRSPISRRVESPPRHRVESPPRRRVESPPRRRVDSPPRRRRDSPPRRRDSPRRRPSSPPPRRRSPSLPPRRHRSPIRISPRRVRGSPVGRKRSPVSHRRRSPLPRRGRTPPRRSPLHRRSRSPVRRPMRSKSRSLSPPRRSKSAPGSQQIHQELHHHTCKYFRLMFPIQITVISRGTLFTDKRGVFGGECLPIEARNKAKFTVHTLLVYDVT